MTSFAEVDALYASVYAPKPARDAVWKAIVNQTSDHQPRHYYSPELSLALENLTKDETRYTLLFSRSQRINPFHRGRFGCVMVHVYTKKVIDEIDKQTQVCLQESAENLSL